MISGMHANIPYQGFLIKSKICENWSFAHVILHTHTLKQTEVDQ